MLVAEDSWGVWRCLCGGACVLCGGACVLCGGACVLCGGACVLCGVLCDTALTFSKR